MSYFEPKFGGWTILCSAQVLPHVIASPFKLSLRAFLPHVIASPFKLSLRALLNCHCEEPQATWQSRPGSTLSESDYRAAEVNSGCFSSEREYQVSIWLIPDFQVVLETLNVTYGRRKRMHHTIRCWLYLLYLSFFKDFSIMVLNKFFRRSESLR